MIGSTLRSLGQAAEVEAGKKMTPAEEEEAEAGIDTAAVEVAAEGAATKTIHIPEADNWSLDSLENSSDCKDPNSASTDCRRAAAAAAEVPLAAEGSDSTSVAGAEAEQTLTAAAGGMACTTPWLDAETQ